MKDEDLEKLEARVVKIFGLSLVFEIKIQYFK